MQTLSESVAFGGIQGVYRHASEVCGCDMTFALYLPPQARKGRVPVLWYLSGLTCTHENAMVKAGAQAHAAREGLPWSFPTPRRAGPGLPTTRPLIWGRVRASMSMRPRHPGRRISGCGPT